MFGWLSCERFCRCASKKKDHELTWYQIPGYCFHYLICLSCRRYRCQIEVVDEVLEGRADDMLDEDDTLSREASQRIKKLLTDEPPV